VRLFGDATFAAGCRRNDHGCVCSKREERKRKEAGGRREVETTGTGLTSCAARSLRISPDKKREALQLVGMKGKKREGRGGKEENNASTD